MKNVTTLIFLLIVISNGYAQVADTITYWKIDSIQIEKNWRTRNKIILRELLFSAGDIVDQNQLETSINQIWNIGNFADVDYSFDTISPNNYLLNIKAKDAFTLLPNLSFNGNKDDYNIMLGIRDNNFLGRNITLDITGNLGTYSKNYNFSIHIPRQLLYKNMTLSFQALNGSATSYRYEKDQKSSVIAYRKKQFSGAIGNPWHTDYFYTFSPNLSWTFFQHQTDSALVDTEVPFSDNYKINYFALSIGESIGLINRKRHQKDGYLISGGYGIGIGLNDSSPMYHSLGFGASFYKTLNPVVELSAGFLTGYTSSTIPSLIHYMSSGDIKGLLNGQESGQGHFNGKLNGSFTYLHYNWFALEHSVYTHFGNADDHYFEIFKEIPRISFGTEIRIWTPMVPWFAASIHFVYLKGNTNWFHLNI